MTAPIAPEPDTKDWTWVLSGPCPDCGFDASTMDRAALPGIVDRTVEAFALALSAPDARTRPSPQIWSPLEYAAHVGDAIRLFQARFTQMLNEPDAAFANWDQDQTALERRYWQLKPSAVAAELRQAAASLLATYRSIGGDQWNRVGRRSNGSVFTVTNLGRYLAHDLVHHVWDIR